MPYHASNIAKPISYAGPILHIAIIWKSQSTMKKANQEQCNYDMSNLNILNSSDYVALEKYIGGLQTIELHHQRVFNI